MLRSITLLATALLSLSTLSLRAQDAPVLQDVIDNHILPRFAAIDNTGAELQKAAQANCAPNDPALRTAYHNAFDAWISASHIRFGPAEDEQRGYAMGFWPDPKGFTTKSLAGLITDEDPIVFDAQEYTEVSIAARGFYALEALLFDEWINAQGTAEYRCALIRAVATDIAGNAHALNADWTGPYVAKFGTLGADQMHENEESAVQVLLNALVTGYQFTEEARLGRPLGTFDRPRPKRAEAQRSERSLRNVALSLASLTDLAQRLSEGHPELQTVFTDGLERADIRMADLSPTFAEVEDISGRLKVEILQQETARLREAANTTLATFWGVAVGFNALDGD